MQTRENALHEWLKTLYPAMDFTLTPLAGDASFRRYYRLQQELLSHIVMDAPPAEVALQPFVTVAEMLSEQGIKTPHIHAIDYAAGFALLEDFGNVLFRDALTEQSTTTLYQKAIEILCQLHQGVTQPQQLAAFDQTFMLQEIALFQEWFLKRYLGLSLSVAEQQFLKQTFQQLTTAIAQQPQVLIHRDYHSRNIMLPDYPHLTQPFTVGVIDFQDAMLGPLTYDLVSLLKDCYIQLSPQHLQDGLRYFFELSPMAKHYSFPDFQQAFDWCGLQRHLKVLGIFCRLHFRDGKSNYLQDLPLTFQYVMTCVGAYQEFEAFGQWLQERVQEPFMSQFK